MTHDPIHPGYMFRDEAHYVQYLKRALDLVRRNSQGQGERQRVIAELREIRHRDELHRLMVVMTDIAAFTAHVEEGNAQPLDILDPATLPTLPR
jgi:hypothetical protein